MSMEHQTKLSGFFSTRKRGSEGVHPAKRRKLLEVDNTGSAPLLSTKAQRPTNEITPTRPNTRRSRRIKASRGKETIGSYNVTSILKRSGIGSLGKKDVNAISETTSVRDDHAFEETLNGTRDANQRKRKKAEQTSKSPEVTASKESAKASRQTGKAALSTKNSKDASLPSSLDGPAETKKRRDTQSEQLTGSTASSEEKAGATEQGMSNPSITDSNTRAVESKDHGSNQSLLSPRKPSVVKKDAGGLKLDPWISEQAKAVLFSRGQKAVALSNERRNSAKAVNKSAANKKGGGDKSAAQQNLEKARQLLRTMRSLESHAAKPKDVTTAEHGEALHRMASLQEASAKSPEKAPAFQRLHALAEPAGVCLPLPYKYKVLNEMFYSADTLLNLMGQRKATCTFPKLKEAIQQMSRKRFEKKHLAQMMAVYPSAYHCEQKQSLHKESVYELTVQFGSSKPTLQTSELISRRKVFQSNLLALTKKHHQDFLSTLTPPVCVEDSRIIRWHPQFRLDSVPDIDQFSLPEAPIVKTYSTAQDVLSKACDLMPPRVEKALMNVAKKQEKKSKEMTAEGNDENKQKADSETKSVTRNGSVALKGISQDLLNKIRQKEAKKLEESMMRDPKIDRKLAMRERLPELCRILRTYFITERKAAIPLEDATSKLAESSASSLSPAQVEEHMRLIGELAPEWLAILTVRKCTFVKINKKADINSVINKLLAKDITC